MVWIFYIAHELTRMLLIVLLGTTSQNKYQNKYSFQALRVVINRL